MRFTKAITLLISIVISLLIFTGCGDGIPKETSEEMYELGVAALEIADDFVDDKITGSEAEERLENNYYEAELQYDIECKKFDSDTLTGTEYSNDYFIESDILFLKWAVNDKVDGTGTENDVISKRNDLAERLNKKKR